MLIEPLVTHVNPRSDEIRARLGWAVGCYSESCRRRLISYSKCCTDGR